MAAALGIETDDNPPSCRRKKSSYVLLRLHLKSRGYIQTDAAAFRTVLQLAVLQRSAAGFVFRLPAVPRPMKQLSSSSASFSECSASSSDVRAQP